MKGIVGGYSKDSGEVRFGEEGLAVVYLVDAHVGAGGVIISYIANSCRKVIKCGLEINEIIYLYWWLS